MLTYQVMEQTEGAGGELYKGDSKELALKAAQDFVSQWQSNERYRRVDVTQFCPCGENKVTFSATIN